MWAGYLAKLSDWTRFSREWRSVVIEPPSLPYWHQASARKREIEPFTLLSRAELDSKEERLAQLIEKHSLRLNGIVVRLPWAYLDEYVKDKIQFGRTLSKRERKALGADAIERPHTICFASASYMAVAIMKKLGPDMRLNYYCEMNDGNSYEGLLLRSWAMLKMANPEFGRVLGDLTFSPGKTGQIPPLEAADMLAWHVGQRAKRSGVDDPMWKYLCQLTLGQFSMNPGHLARYVMAWNAEEAAIRQLFGKS